MSLLKDLGYHVKENVRVKSLQPVVVCVESVKDFGTRMARKKRITRAA